MENNSESKKTASKNNFLDFFRNIKKQLWIVFAGVIIIILVLALIDQRNLGSMQMIVVIISSVAAAVVTYLLLQGQKLDQDKQRELDREWEIERREREQEWQEKRQDLDAKRSKDARIYSNKIAAFSAFNKAVWQDNLDYREDVDKIVSNIRTGLFSRVILYLSSKEIDEVTKAVASGPNNELSYVLSSIVNILNRNAEETLAGEKEKEKETDDAYQTSCRNLWNQFNEWLDSLAKSAEPEIATEAASTKKLKAGIQSWHFCMWSWLQIERMRSDASFNELSLVEYGDTWRTELVKQVKKGDLVFLFQGSKRYAGAFVAKGWRVFEYDTDRNVTEITSSPDIAKVIAPNGKVPISDVAEKLAKYDIYRSFESPDSTSCANVVVDTLSFPEKGVQNPNTTYRRTISRYYSGYAVKLLEEFMKADSEHKDDIAKYLE